MKKNLYYAAVFRRRNVLKEFLYSLFLGLASWPRLLLEVFVRKNMGERYFSFSTAIIMLIFLSILPFASAGLFAGMHSMSPFSNSPYGSYNEDSTGFWHILFTNMTWYLFLAAFLYVCLERRKEIKRLPSVFDFARFSLSTGIVHPKFYDLKINGKEPSIRRINTVYEPAFFFLIGLVLSLCRQSVGGLITFCSLVYSGSYFAAYHIGDNFVMDKIDEMICNEELVHSFVEGRKPEETRGFSSPSRKPSDPELRRKVVDSFFEDNDDTAEAK